MSVHDEDEVKRLHTESIVHALRQENDPDRIAKALLDRVFSSVDYAGLLRGIADNLERMPATGGEAAQGLASEARQLREVADRIGPGKGRFSGS